MSVKLESRWKLDIRGIFKTHISSRFEQNQLLPQSSSTAETISTSGWPHERRMTSFIFCYISLNIHNCTFQNVIRQPRRKLVPGHFYINLVFEEAPFTAETISNSGLPHERRMKAVIFSFLVKLYIFVRSKTWFGYLDGSWYPVILISILLSRKLPSQPKLFPLPVNLTSDVWLQ